jgi:hypothetical protein
MSESISEQSFYPGDVVYCLAGERDKSLAVEKATVDSPARLSEMDDDLPYHYLIVWDRVDQDPEGEGATITKMPAEMFTHQEVEELLNKNERKHPRDIDGLVAHPVANHNLAGPLGGAIINRLVETPQMLISAFDRTVAWQ